MRHRQLINIAHQLNYPFMTGGLCSGFTSMWSQAVCSNDLKRFDAMLALLEHYADNSNMLKQHVDLVRKSLSQIPLSNDDEKILATLSPKTQHQLLNIPAFFEGIAFYQKPEIGIDLFGDKMTFLQFNRVLISDYVQSAKLAALNGLAEAFCTSDYYNQQQLVSHLDKLSDALKDMSNVGIELVGHTHAVAIRVIADGLFELIDTNQLDERGRLMTSQQLAKNLDNALFNSSWLDWLIGPKPLFMTTSIFTNKKALPIKPLAHLKQKKSPKQSLSTQQLTNLLERAALHNDVDTLKRFDLTTIDLPPLIPAILSCHHEGFDHILAEVHDIDVNQSRIPRGLSPLVTAIVNRAYGCATAIINHRNFKKSSSIEAGYNIFMLISIQDNVTNEMLNFVETSLKRKEFKEDVINLALSYACHTGSLDLVKLFQAYGAQLETLDEGMRSPLHIAITTGNKDLVNYLLKQGCNRNALTSMKESPLHFACYKNVIGNEEMVKLLIDYPSMDPLDFNNRATTDQLTPLGRACKNERLELIPLLLPHTTLSVADIQSHSPIMQQIIKCDNTIRKQFLKNALSCYINHRLQQGKYLSYWPSKFNKTEKIEAAQALLDVCEDNNVNLKNHLAALKNGRLSCLYTLYQQDYELQPSIQIKQLSSYEKMMELSLIPNSTIPKRDFQESRTRGISYLQSNNSTTSSLPILKLDNAEHKQSSIVSGP